MTPLVQHAMQRAFERYGEHLNRVSYYALVKRIQNGDSVCIKRMSNDRSIHLVDGMVCVYSKRRHKIVTFLPADCREMTHFIQ
jgi:hypothetical protein